MATFPVKYVHSAMRGAPVLSGTAGALIALLDACLITGFGQVTLTSLVVSGGVATATVGAGDTFEEGAVILVDGATPAALNGEQRVLSSTSTTFTFATTAPDGAATGVITAKYAPVGGWEKVFSGTNTAVYRSTDLQAFDGFTRIDDTGTTSARMRNFESMSDVDTGSGPSPTDAQFSGGGYLLKSFSATSDGVRWKLFADSRMVHMCIAIGTSVGSTLTPAPARGFGDLIALRPGGDSWCRALSAASASTNFFSQGAFSSPSDGGTSGAVVVPRALSGLGESVYMDIRSYASESGAAASGATGIYGAFPSEVDGKMLVSKIFVREKGGKPPRAEIPGILFIAQSSVAALVKDGDILDGAGELAGRRLVAVGSVSSGGPAVPNSIYLVDATGPWR